MVVLSLFDGMSCGQIALHELGIIPETYYASEIDKFAIAQTQLNFPDTIQLGDVAEVDVSRLKPVDLLIGGSSCQSFSFAGKRAGMKTTENEEIYTLDRYLQLKADGFKFEGQSYLFWEYMRILTDIRKYNPNVLFLLENVEMGKKWERVLSDAIGLYGVHINSALVSAQNRKRVYWTNIRTRQEGLFGDLYSDIPQPEDKGILLRDILDEDVGEKYYLSDMKIEWLEKHSAKTGNAFHKFTGTDKACCITSTAEVKNNLSTNYVCVAMRGRNPDNPSNRTSGIHTEQRIEPNMDGKTNCLTSVQKDNLILQRPRGNNQGGEFTEKAPTLTSNHWEQNNLLMKRINQLNISDESNGRQPYQQNRVFDIDGISPALMNGHAGQTINVLIKNKRIKDNLRRTDDKSLTLRATSYKGAESNGMTLVKNGEYRIRRLTPTECARLQTIPDWYKWQCSETQQYKMLGNGWTVAVVSHILQYLKFKTLQS
jgi:DNA (cytosine-5)-methyltransferase 3A